MLAHRDAANNDGTRISCLASGPPSPPQPPAIPPNAAVMDISHCSESPHLATMAHNGQCPGPQSPPLWPSSDLAKCQNAFSLPFPPIFLLTVFFYFYLSIFLLCLSYISAIHFSSGYFSDCYGFLSSCFLAFLVFLKFCWNTSCYYGWSRGPHIGNQ